MDRKPQVGTNSEASHAKPEFGSALVFAMFVLVMLSAMAGALLFTTDVEVKMSTKDLQSKQAFYLAEAGEESAREYLFVTNVLDDLTDDLETAAGDNNQLDFEPDKLVPVYDGAGNAIGISGFGDDEPLQAVTAMGSGFYAAFLTNDPDEGWTNTTDTNRLVTITGVGGGADGSFEIVQAVVAPDRPLPEMPRAAITLLGPDPNFWGGNSNGSEYIGEDCAGAGKPGLVVPVVGTIGEEAEKRAEDGIFDSNGPDYESGEATGKDAFADLTDKEDPLVAAAGAIDDEWLDCEELKKLVEDLRQKATWSCANRDSVALVTDENGERQASGHKCVVPSNSSAGDIIFIDGNTAISHQQSGAGILIVTGALYIQGKASWNGAVLAIGEGKITRYGAGNGSVSGGIVVADISGDDGIYGTEDDCGTDNEFGDADYQVDGGGTGDTTFCSTDIEAANPPEPYKIVSFRQG